MYVRDACRASRVGEVMRSNVSIKVVIISCVMLSCVATTHAQAADSKDIIATYGSDIDSLRDGFNKQAEVISKIADDQQRDRAQMLNVMESIVDRLNRIDKNMQVMEEKINNMDSKGNKEIYIVNRNTAKRR